MYLPSSTVAYLVLIACTVFLFKWSTTRIESVLDTEIPVVGLRKEWFAWLRVVARSLSQTQTLAFEGYRKYTKNDSAFIAPTIDRGPVVVLPLNQVKKIYSLPEDKLDVHTTNNETIQVKWTVADPEIYENDFQINVIRHQMTRNLVHLTPPIFEEVRFGFDKWWGTDTKHWKDVYLFDTCLKIIAGASNGAFCGQVLCRNETFLKRLQAHAMSVFAGAMLISCTPPWLRFITGNMVKLHCKYRLRRVFSICVPVVQERLKNTAKLLSDPDFEWELPKDGLQWIIDEAYATKDPAQLNATRIAHRLVLTNDVSLHSTSYTIHNVVLDVFSNDGSGDLIKVIREECTQALRSKENNKFWTREALLKLKLVDSVIRESMRLWPFGTIGIPRRVVEPSGIEVSPGIRIPKGTICMLPLESIHRDDEIYPKADTFDPYRFLGTQSTRNIFNQADNFKQTNEDSEMKSKSSATLDEAFLGFGFGKHACPGRFFAINEMKVFMAYLVQHYDVEFIRERPEPVSVVWLKYPLDKVKMRVRRRAVST